MLSSCFHPLFIVCQMPMAGFHTEVTILFMTLLNSFILLFNIYLIVSRLYVYRKRQKSDFTNISSHVELMKNNLKSEIVHLDSIVDSIQDNPSQNDIDFKGYCSAIRAVLNRLEVIQDNLNSLSISTHEGTLPKRYSVISTPEFRVEDFVSQPATALSTAQSESLSGELFVEKLNQYIEQHLSNPDFSVNTLAQELCVSRSSLFAKVKDATGETPNNLLVKARLSAAAKLLEKKERAVNEICYMVGFSSPSYFSRCFVKYYGITPHEWANKNKNQ